jgi:DNA-binding NarL/FixJ family response regulator
VLMDIAMPRQDGMAATRTLLSTPNPPRIIVLTTFDTDENLYRALQAGASGFLLKVSSPEHLITAIRVVAGGEALLDPAVTTRVISAFAGRPGPEPPPELSELTPREVDVLRLMARGMSNAEISAALTVGEATVKTHVARVLMKLGLRDRVQAVVYAYESGLVRAGAS